ncbi:RDD family protein [Microbacterium sp. bgisy189]|uniref:RDD family protein n=1 Tax=Microbacterium sp. bgisy189 TaxID=3413798 RepID=UPI003EBD4C37
MGTPAPAAQIAQDEILTGEAVALDVQPVGFFMRALGTLIDVIASIALVILFIIVFAWIGGNGVDLLSIGTIVTISTMVLITIVIPTAIETATRGRSLGKLAVGSRIVRADGGAIGFRHAFIRALVGVLEIWFTMGAIAGVVGAFTPRAQRLGDLLAGTYAERTRAPKLPWPAGGIPPALTEWARTADVARLPDRVARRAGQFVRSADKLLPHARARAATTIAAEVRPFVSPVPEVDPETFLRAVVAVRRDREYAALELQSQRVSGLLVGVSDTPRDFPQR